MDPNVCDLPGLPPEGGKGALFSAIAMNTPITSVQASLNSMSFLHQGLADTLNEELQAPMIELAAQTRGVAGYSEESQAAAGQEV
eukprot:4991895-Pyramimonas_sp.AAC.1